MSVVYEAVEESLHRVVALKVIPEPLSREAEDVRRFHQEARAAAQLNHPNIVTIYSIGNEGDVHFIAMEYIKGKELSKIITMHDQMDVGDALAVGRRVASALAAAHEVGIVHRDIKPQNIMVDDLGDVKVMDFGIAKVGAGLSTTVTSKGLLFGTPAYMAPEQFKGAPLDGRCDLYSLGVVLYQALAGRVPFDDESPASLMQRVLNETPPPIQTFNGHISSEVARLIERAMAKDPSERFQSGREMQEAIDQILAPTTVRTYTGADHPTEILDRGDLQIRASRIISTLREHFQANPLRLLAAGLASTILALFVTASVLFDQGNAGVEIPNNKNLLRGVSINQPPPDAASETDFTTDPASVGADSIGSYTDGNEQESVEQTQEDIRRAISLYNGASGRVDEVTAKGLVLRASEANAPLARMWRAWFTYWGRCGFESDLGRAEKLAKSSIDRVRELAEQGNADAAFLIGVALDLGLGTETDPPIALQWINKAVQSGHMNAMTYLGWMHFTGRGVKANPERAFSLFESAAKAGDVNAMHNLGWMYANGDGVDRDDALAVRWFRRAAKIGSPVNMNNLGWMYEKGRGVTQNREKAVQWYRRAAELGDETSQANLSNLGVAFQEPKPSDEGGT